MGTHSQVCRTALHAPLLPNLAGLRPTCLRPLSVDKESKLPPKSATVTPAPAQGAPQDRTQTGTAISPFPQARQTAGVRHPAAPSLSKTPPWRDPRRTARTAEGGPERVFRTPLTEAPAAPLAGALPGILVT